MERGWEEVVMRKIPICTNTVCPGCLSEEAWCVWLIFNSAGVVGTCFAQFDCIRHQIECCTNKTRLVNLMTCFWKWINLPILTKYFYYSSIYCRITQDTPAEIHTWHSWISSFGYHVTSVILGGFPGRCNTAQGYMVVFAMSYCVTEVSILLGDKLFCRWCEMSFM